MEVNPLYLTYDDYVTRGGTLSEDVFNYIESKAERKLDYYTHMRVRYLENDGTPIPKEVSDVIYEFIKFLENPTTADKTIASYSNGIESFTFNQNVDPFVELYNLAREYLDVDLISACVD